MHPDLEKFGFYRETAEGEYKIYPMTFDELVLASPAMENVTRLGRRAAQSNIPVLIEGESGVGKELVP